MFSVLYAIFSPASQSIIITNITLDIIALLIYLFSVQFFRSENKWLVCMVILLSFLTLAISVCYDFLIGLPKHNIKLVEAVRKGGFGENPNQAASGIKFLALGSLVFFNKYKLKKTLIIVFMVLAVFLTFSRSGIISVILLLVFGIANNWDKKFKITVPVLFKSVIKMTIVFSIIYLGLVLLADLIKATNPSFTRGSAGARIDLLIGKSDKSIIAEDRGTGGGRGDLLLNYIEDFTNKPFGYGTAYTSDKRYNPLNTHNYYLFLAVNYGILALIVYFIYLWSGFKRAIKRDKFYYIIFLALLLFEGFISHSIIHERALLISLALFDSFIYNTKIHNDS